MKPTRQSFKIGSKKFGTLLVWPDGRSCVMLSRSRKDIFREDAYMISHAMEKQSAFWSVERMVLSSMRRRNIRFLAIRVTQDGEIYLTTLQRWHLHAQVKSKVRQKNGSAQLSLSIEYFVRKPGRIRV